MLPQARTKNSKIPLKRQESHIRKNGMPGAAQINSFLYVIPVVKKNRKNTEELASIE